MIEIQLFKFDSKTDYLPYYKSYSLKRDSVNTIDDVLNAINSREKFGYIQDEPFFLRVNNIYIASDTNINDVINHKSELLIEPLSIKRAVNDLIIDTDDYRNKLSFLDKYLEHDVKTQILHDKNYMLEYYASNTLHFNDDYIGEHVLFIASELVQRDESLIEELSKLVDNEDGIRLRTSLKHRVLDSHEEVAKDYEVSTLDSEVIQSFDNFNIALYCALNDASFESVIQESNANYVELQSKHFDIPRGSSKLAYLMAGTVLLEAMDNNADFLIVNDEEELALFDEKQKSIEKAMGREIDLPVLTRNEFIKILQGEKDKKTIGIAFHKIKVPFLDA